MKAIFRGFLVGATLLGLAACGHNDVAVSWADADAAARQAEAVQKADWSKATTITITLDANNFAPFVINLHKDQPYTLKLVNSTKPYRSFAAPDFLGASAVQSITDQAEADKGKRLVSIAMPGETTREVKLVPMEAGRFDFFEGGESLPIGITHDYVTRRQPASGPFGLIVVN